MDPAAGQSSWALLADKGYTGAHALVRAITPKKALPNRRLSTEDFVANQRLSSARVICENCYGRMKGLFAICTEKFRGWQSANDSGNLASFALASDLCIALTNFHIKYHPLRQTDSDLYLQILASYERKGREKMESEKTKYATRRAIKQARFV